MPRRLRSHQQPIPTAAASSFVSTPPICDDTSIGVQLHPPIVVSTPPTVTVAATIRLPIVVHPQPPTALNRRPMESSFREEGGAP
ncbi:hypothetical protein ACLOJK_028161 [Asimina triloba]